jgi:hypothetical protein
VRSFCVPGPSRPGAKTQSQSDTIPWCITPGILPSAIRASLRLFKIAPGDFVAPNSKHRALVTPAKRGKGNKPKAADVEDEKTPVQRHAAMTGFCSCKTGIHAIHGNNLGPAPQATGREGDAGMKAVVLLLA